MAPAPPSPDDTEGYWGPPTSTLDWCEENYVDSYYIAEFWNTLTNLAMIILPIVSSIYMWKEQVEFRFIIANLSLLVVGIGSWCFHMTLLYGMQLFDELPMIWGSLAFVYCSFESRAKPNSYNAQLFLFLLAYSIVTTVGYITVVNPLFHQVSYGILVFMLLGQGVYILRYYGHDLDKFLYFYTIALYAMAFALWNIDNIFCSNVRAARKALPFPLNVTTQLHGWWHILAGTSTHCLIVVTCHFRSRFLRKKTHLEYAAGLVPFVRHPSEVDELNHNHNL